MKKSQAVQSERIWTSPKLIVYGPVEEITGLQDKKLGSTDGFTFMGEPIANAS